MKLIFKYDIDKDIENYYIVSKSVNLSKRRDEYEAKFGKILDNENLRKFINQITIENKINFEEIINKFENLWQPINDGFFDRIFKIFKINLPVNLITVYLTTNDRCGYSIENNYFFISAGTKCPKLTILHELFHFYTWYALGDDLKNKNINKKTYYDIKESLTEILNMEFSDLLDCTDKGYPQHENLRVLVKNHWLNTKNIKETFYGVLGSSINSRQ
ncbi:MAG: hypothetical protein ABIJ17_00940 [Patescibacteria group bacterium]